ncbi:MAG: FABP family protein [Acidimicrobiales bacterium]
MNPDLHPDLESLAFLIGTWRGSGHGEYPTIESFAYLEEVTIGHVGKPFLAYTQKTRDARTNLPLHAETGYFRSDGPGRAELVVAQPSGIVEIHTGLLKSHRLSLESVRVATSPTAKEVTSVTRTIEVHGDTMHYRVAMAAVGQPLQHHLAATLERVTPQ